MPVISAIGVPVPGYVYVETSWADVPTATSVCVDRVDTVTGERFPLRPYVSYSADGCLDLSCGLGIFWDTEASFDTPYQYCATATDAAGTVLTTTTGPLVLDTFSRVVANGWGTPDIGPVWTTSGGAVGDYSVNGSRGQHSLATVNVGRMSRMAMTSPNETLQVTAIPTAVATGGIIQMTVQMRSDGTANFYDTVLVFQPSGQVDVSFRRVLLNVQTILASTASFMPYNATTQVVVKMRVWGSQLQVTIWDLTTPEPAVTFTAVDTTFAAGALIAVQSFRSLANTNVGLVTQWDNLRITDVCAEPIPLEVCSGTVTLEGDGCFRLGDPVRPCSDQHVCLDEESECSVEEVGIYFGTMTPGTYADNSGQLLPVNARRPIVVSRERRDVQSELVLVTRTFDDRDNVLLLNQPGTPLLWRGPASYGTGDRYMSVLDVDLSPSFLDLQEEPRILALPHWATDPPVGPSLGICGTRVMDLCDVYPTWDAMVAAGLTYADLLRGEAGTGVSVNLAVWNDVNADFADWNALNAAEADWDDTWQGFP